jgi:hypothetical protein
MSVVAMETPENGLGTNQPDVKVLRAQIETIAAQL